MKVLKGLLYTYGLFAFGSSYSQVAVRFEPRHKVALENDYIRLLDVHISPGDTSLFHIHQIPSYFIPLSNTAIGSEVKGQDAQESRMKAGATWYNGFEKGPLIHKVWDSDTGVLHVIDLELLASKNSVLPDAATLSGLNIDFENEKIRVYKFDLIPAQVLVLPKLETPMVFISVSGPAVQVTNQMKTDDIAFINAGSYRWIAAKQKFHVENKSNLNCSVILIMLK